MPEQLTKHPDITLQVLRSAGATCGEGAVQDILTQCPASRFCKLPGGEVCVFGLAEASRMTQVSPAEWHALVQRVTPGGLAPSGGMPMHDLWLGAGLGLLAGLAVARWWRPPAA